MYAPPESCLNVGALNALYATAIERLARFGFSFHYIPAGEVGLELIAATSDGGGTIVYMELNGAMSGRRTFATDAGVYGDFIGEDETGDMDRIIRWASGQSPVTVLTADSGREAYDNCQCDDDWAKTGLVFEITGAPVVGVTGAWPFVVTASRGKDKSLHTTDMHPRDWNEREAGATREQHAVLVAGVDAAIAYAKSKGYPLAAWAALPEPREEAIMAGMAGGCEAYNEAIGSALTGPADCPSCLRPKGAGHHCCMCDDDECIDDDYAAAAEAQHESWGDQWLE
jgi:hypothetical protein